MKSLENFPVRIEKMKDEHLNEVLRIEEISFPTPWSREAFKAEIENNDFAHYFVLMNNSHVIGYAGMWIILDESHITTIAIHPSFRRKHLAKLLLSKLMEEAIIFGADKITLEVRPSNKPARNLYQRLGFKPVGIRKNYYTDNNEDAIIMWKSLRR